MVSLCGAAAEALTVVSSKKGLPQKPSTAASDASECIGSSKDGGAVIVAVLVHIPDLWWHIEVLGLLALLQFRFSREANCAVVNTQFTTQCTGKAYIQMSEACHMGRRPSDL